MKLIQNVGSANRFLGVFWLKILCAIGTFGSGTITIHFFIVKFSF